MLGALRANDPRLVFTKDQLHFDRFGRNELIDTETLTDPSTIMQEPIRGLRLVFPLHWVKLQESFRELESELEPHCRSRLSCDVEITVKLFGHRFLSL